MALGLHFAVRSDVGLLRAGNEDAAYAGPRLLAVADGMGGHAAGEVASRLAIARMAALDDGAAEPDLLAALRAAVDQAQEDIRSMVSADPTVEGMGTTLTALLWTGTSLGLAHVGDSRAYLFRGGTLQRITHDHTYVQDLIDSGQITADDAVSHPQRSLLTRALDGRLTVDPDLSVREVCPGDRYLLCSDGLSGVVSDVTMADALAAKDVDTAADQLVELALRGGGPDNITVVVCDIADNDAQTSNPVVVGAAADVALPTRGGDTPAGRAALALGRAHRLHRRRRAAAMPPRPSPPPSRSRRPLWTVLALGVVVAVVVVGGWLWTRTQYFVGVHEGQVTIFRGVVWSFAGLSLHSVSEQVAVSPAQLPDFEQDRLRAGIAAPTLPQARRVVDRLAGEQCAGASGGAGSPSTTPTPSRSAQSAAGPTVGASPTPAACAVAK
jgi:PPM family protein phosphatase